jgi:hypothetical protein
MSVSTRVSFAITAPLLLMLSAAAIQAQDQAQLEAQVQAAKCRPCQVAQERCSVNCFGLADKKAIGPCMVGCGNAAAFCSCDDQATLSAENAAALFGLNAVLPPSSACNSTGSCGSAYGACTNWSGGYPCGDLYCGAAFGCGLCDEWQCESTGPAMRQEWESYRVCFDQHGTPCTEYVRSVSTEGCGC